jgi:Zn-dependent protease
MAEEYFGFKKNEIRDILITTLVLGFLFSFYPGFLPEGYTWFHNLISAILMVLLSLFVHHVGHKLRASRIEAVAEYKLIPQYILLAFFLTIFTGIMVGAGGILVFAAMGFVTVKSRYSPRLGYRWIRITRKEIGEIAWAGPIANIGLAMFFKLLEPLNPAFFNYGIMINLSIAIFHLFPFPPLDGSLIAGWSPMAWIATIIAAILLYVLMPYISFLLALVILIVTLVVIFSILQRYIPNPG